MFHSFTIHQANILAQYLVGLHFYPQKHIITHTIHVWYIFTYIGWFFISNVGIPIAYMRIYMIYKLSVKADVVVVGYKDHY